MEEKIPVFNDCVDELGKYLADIGVNMQKISNNLEKTILIPYQNKINKEIFIPYKNMLIKQNVKASRAYGFTFPVVINYESEPIIAKHIVGINTVFKVNKLRNASFHELLHLFSTNEYNVKSGELKIKSGFLEETTFIEKDTLMTEYESHAMEKINEGVTEYLTECLLEKCGYKKAVEMEYMYVHVMHILNCFLEENLDFHWLLKLYLNNQKEEFFNILEERLGITEEYLLKLRLPLIYSVIFSGTMNKKLLKLIVDIKKNLQEKNVDINFTKVKKNILKNTKGIFFNKLQNELERI